MNQVELKKRQTELVSYVIGMVCLVMIGNSLGDNGIAYFAVAFECFLLPVILLTHKLEDMLGKLLRNRTSKGQYKNAKKFRRNIFLAGAVLGLVGSAALFAAAELLGEKLFGLTYSVAMICILAPVVLLRMAASILLGYFQGEGTELPAVISYIMRQIGIVLLAVLFVKLLGNYGAKVSALLREENFAAMYCGMGYALAMLVSEILVVLFLGFVYQGSRGRAKKGINDGMRVQESFAGQVAAVVSNTFPLTLGALIGHIPVWAGFFFYQKSLEQMTAVGQYGVFYGKYLPIVLIFVLPAGAALLSNSYKLAMHFRRNEPKNAKLFFGGGFHFSFVYGFFFAVYLTVMASTIAELAGGDSYDLTVKMLQGGSFIIPFLVMGYFFSESLLLINCRYQVVVAAAIKSIFFIVVAVVMLRNGVGIMSLVYGGIIAEFFFAVATLFMLCRQLKAGIDPIRQIAIPLGVISVTGLLLWLFGRMLAPHLGSLLSIILSLVFGIICSIVLLIVARDFREQELNQIPGGKLLRTLGQVFHIY